MAAGSTERRALGKPARRVRLYRRCPSIPSATRALGLTFPCHRGSAMTRASDNPLLRTMGGPRPAALRPDQARAFPPGLRRHHGDAEGGGARRSRNRPSRRPLPTRSARWRRAASDLERVAAVFFHLASADTNDALQAIEREMAPLLARHGNEIYLERGAVRAHRRALAEARDAWPRRRAAPGARPLPHHLRARRRRPRRGRQDAAGRDQRAAGRARHPVQPERAGLRERLHAGARRRGRSRRPAAIGALGCGRSRRAIAGFAGKHVITLSRSSIEPFLQFSTRRDLREKAFNAWVTARREGERRR